MRVITVDSMHQSTSVDADGECRLTNNEVGLDVRERLDHMILLEFLNARDHSE
jgi:hypothetical protein